MKLALHRSITFWSGLLVMGFICWAWQDSHRSRSTAEWREMVIVNSDDGLRVSRDSNFDPFVGEWPRPFGISRLPNEGTGSGIFPPPSFQRGPGDAPEQFPNDEGLLESSSLENRPSEDWDLFLPHWLMLLAFAAPWLALLIWRARRRKRHMHQES